ncbi:hypothetical protein LMJF_07_0890 [Leishmania major strain Friedlin]|uniref:Uncharacterized protein n=1 Tax=Leishmania major TaxID=5664 RepID=Q4QIJ8_LEIMA|nr:hypothetical protein LMJF_07_0890 [Leishmania major strain Friedlin]CAG9569033.1 hypothetical_protein_-_conserved [Leishmania major strain Friedlin]CAJ07055.1 hypothetical protein LMJF_07_0890 [Leishmania major strain Friedlin]|eukprot:XP_001681000.1 hypothetical protein LMJF_07_0890 [Leishmania major strain Friedlin]
MSSSVQNHQQTLLQARTHVAARDTTAVAILGAKAGSNGSSQSFRPAAQCLEHTQSSFNQTDISQRPPFIASEAATVSLLRRMEVLDNGRAGSTSDNAAANVVPSHQSVQRQRVTAHTLNKTTLANNDVTGEAPKPPSMAESTLKAGAQRRRIVKSNRNAVASRGPSESLKKCGPAVNVNDDGHRNDSAMAMNVPTQITVAARGGARGRVFHSNPFVTRNGKRFSAQNARRGISTATLSPPHTAITVSDDYSADFSVHDAFDVLSPMTPANPTYQKTLQVQQQQQWHSGSWIYDLNAGANTDSFTDDGSPIEFVVEDFELDDTVLGGTKHNDFGGQASKGGPDRFSTAAASNPDRLRQQNHARWAASRGPTRGATLASGTTATQQAGGARHLTTKSTMGSDPAGPDSPSGVLKERARLAKGVKLHNGPPMIKIPPLALDVINANRKTGKASYKVSHPKPGVVVPDIESSSTECSDMPNNSSLQGNFEALGVKVSNSPLGGRGSIEGRGNDKRVGGVHNGSLLSGSAVDGHRAGAAGSSAYKGSLQNCGRHGMLSMPFDGTSNDSQVHEASPSRNAREGFRGNSGGFGMHGGPFGSVQRQRWLVEADKHSSGESRPPMTNARKKAKCCVVM